ncbi:hypothetical protein FA95DRAFT_606060, partial [Auriscalpium vulgare]
RLWNSDLVYIHHLPSLAELNLNNTGIGDEAAFHLVALRESLTMLVLSNNPMITDDAAPALALLNELGLLHLSGTGITMAGLRRLADAFSSSAEAGNFQIAIPADCEDYMDNLHTCYLLSPAAPLITAVTACASLSVSALKRNLQAHAAYNPDISVTGSKAEMCARLESLLVQRAGDLAVRNMLWNGREAALNGTGE